LEKVETPHLMKSTTQGGSGMEKPNKEVFLFIKRLSIEFQMTEEEVKKWVMAELTYLNKFK
jgi:hypothetical protein